MPPIARTLRPVREESVDFDTTKNLFIEGDNLDALKLLQESYLGKVKLIYIDPPYNTGSDFVYADDFAETTAEYLRALRPGRRRRRPAGRQHRGQRPLPLRLAEHDVPAPEAGAEPARRRRGDLRQHRSTSTSMRKLLNEVMGEVLPRRHHVAKLVWQRTTRENDFTVVRDMRTSSSSSRSDQFAVNLLPRTAEDGRAVRQSGTDGPRGPWKGASLPNPATAAQRPRISATRSGTRTPGRPRLAVGQRLAQRPGLEFGRPNSRRRGLHRLGGPTRKSPVPSVKTVPLRCQGTDPTSFWSDAYRARPTRAPGTWPRCSPARYAMTPKTGTG